MTPSRLLGALYRLYLRLLRAFPESFLDAHGDELTLTAELLTTHTRPTWRVLWSLSPMIPDLLRQLLREYAHELRYDLRYALRYLATQPTFAAVTILSLALSISMVTSLWSQFEMALFRPTPGVPHAGRLVALQSAVDYPFFSELGEAGPPFEHLAAYLAPVPLLLGEPSASHRTWGQLVSADYFETLGVRPYLGHLLQPAGNRPGQAPTAVLSHRLWLSRFGGDRQILGRAIRINGQSVTVVGVTPPGFLGSSPLFSAGDLFLPLAASAAVAPELGAAPLAERRDADLRLIGTLAPGLTRAAAEATLDSRLRAYRQRTLHADRDRPGRQASLIAGGRLLPLRDEDILPQLGLPLVLGGLMLWIGCTNVAAMLLAKAFARRREIATRLALGARRARLVRQLLTESCLLSLAGALVAIPFAYWSHHSFDQLRPMFPDYVQIDLPISLSALAATLAVGLATGLIFGLAPALQATAASVSPALKAGSDPTSLHGRPTRWFSSRNLLIVQQVASSLVLLMLTSFVILSFQRGSRLDLGYDPHEISEFHLDPLRDGYTSPATLQLFEDLAGRLTAVDGLTGAALATHSPLDVLPSSEKVSRGSASRRDETVFTARLDHVGSGYFEALGLPLLAGRGFSAQDLQEGSLVAVVNETLARRQWPGASALGQTLTIRNQPHRIIGITRDTHSGWIINMLDAAVYLPLHRAQLLHPYAEGLTLLVRARPGLDVPARVRQALASWQPRLTLFSAGRLSDRVERNFYFVRMVTWTYGLFGLYGLLLTAIGLAGVTAQAVLRRTREIGIRTALGARPHNILALVLGEGTCLTLAGLTLGAGGALAGAALLRSFLSILAQTTGTPLSDPWLLIGAPALLLGLTWLACYVPARRALRINPVEALRSE